jgi:hypothetical protein
MYFHVPYLDGHTSHLGYLLIQKLVSWIRGKWEGPRGLKLKRAQAQEGSKFIPTTTCTIRTFAPKPPWSVVDPVCSLFAEARRGFSWGCAAPGDDRYVAWALFFESWPVLVFGSRGPCHFHHTCTCIIYMHPPIRVTRSTQMACSNPSGPRCRCRRRCQ